MRHVFCRAIQGTYELSIDFVIRLGRLASTYEFADQNTEIRDQFIKKYSSNCLRRRLLQEHNLTQVKAVEKIQTMELLEKQSTIIQPEETQARMGRPKVTQDKYGFPSNK